MKYFAYGMNTNRSQMATRCAAAVSLGHAVLPDYEFRFAHHADVLENAEFDVNGVLWEITEECLKSLDALEGYPYYYGRKEVTVLHDNEPVQAIVYYMQPGAHDSLPSQGYLAMVTEGYNEHNVPTEQLDEAIRFINRSPLPELEFQYE